jgi:hypothetical protein
MAPHHPITGDAKRVDPTYAEARALAAGIQWKSTQPELTAHYFAQIASAFAPKAGGK